MKNFFYILMFPLLLSCETEPLEYDHILVKETVSAKSANDFLNSIGVNSSIVSRGEYLYQTIDFINYLGARWIRGGYGADQELDDIITLHKETGAKVCIGTSSGGDLTTASLTDKILKTRKLAEAGALLAFEGPNEPNNWSVVYNGVTGGSNGTWLPIADLMRDLYSIVKGDEVLKKYPVFHISENGAETDNVGLQYLEIPEGSSSLYPVGTKFADYANCHNYISHPSWPGIHDNMTWRASDPSADSHADGLYGNYGITWVNGFSGYTEKELATLPRVTTETGITIGQQGEDILTEEMQGCMYMNLYLAQFKRGWAYTAIYLLKTHSDETNHAAFAFFNQDGTPKVAAHYLHNLTSILADNPQAETTLETLTFSIPMKPATVHYLLLQKSTGRFMLVVWDEKYSGGNEKVTINFDNTFKSVKIYDPTYSSSEIETLDNVNSVRLTMSTYPYVLELQK